MTIQIKDLEHIDCGDILECGHKESGVVYYFFILKKIVKDNKETLECLRITSQRGLVEYFFMTASKENLSLYNTGSTGYCLQCTDCIIRSIQSNISEIKQ